MLVRKLEDCKEFTAGDGAFLRELLHPDKDNLKIRYSFAAAKVLPGQTTKRHRLQTSEIYYILKGKGLMRVGEEHAEVSPGCLVYIPPNADQRISNTSDEDLEFVCIVDPAWKPKDEEIFDE